MLYRLLLLAGAVCGIAAGCAGGGATPTSPDEARPPGSCPTAEYEAERLLRVDSDYERAFDRFQEA